MNTTSYGEVLNITASTSVAHYCNLTSFSKTYAGYHGYLSLIVCTFGSVTNILNICVLTTKEMRWPTNLILTGLAVADLLVMLEYIPFTVHNINPQKRYYESHFSYPWAVYTYFHALFTQVFHFISCCLTVILAIWRYIAISRAQNNRLLQIVTSVPRTLLTIFLTYLWCPLICLPLFMAHSVVIKNSTVDLKTRRLIENKNVASYVDPMEKVTIYTVGMSGTFRGISIMIYGFILKLTPCVLLTILSIRLISALLETKKRRRLLLINSGVPLIEINGKKSVKVQKNLEKEQQTDRTTRMLLAVLMLFLITELPQATLAFLALMIGEKFAMQCYIPLGELMDILALTNSAINFVLYCSMSRQFRVAFREVFRPRVLRKWLPLPQRSEINGGATQVTLV